MYEKINIGWLSDREGGKGCRSEISEWQLSLRWFRDFQENQFDQFVSGKSVKDGKGNY